MQITYFNSKLVIAVLLLLILGLHKLYQYFNRRENHKDKGKSINRIMTEGLDEWYRSRFRKGK
jgi:putative Mn2+ efflux pump MntP